MKLPSILRIAFSLVILFGAPRLFGQYVRTTNLFPVADATIREDAPDNNYGGASSVTAGLSSDGSSLSRALFKFDLSTIPTNAIVTNITFSLIELGQSPAQNMFFLSPLLTYWIESEVTWNNPSVGMPWAQRGGAFSAESALAYLSSGAAGTTNQFTDNGETPGYGLVADAQSWIGNPVRNFGWILTAWPEDTAGSAFQFGSRENRGAAPFLTVGYTVPFTPAMVKVLSAANGQFCFTFNIEPFHGYLIQSSGDLSATANWITLLVLDPPPAPMDTSFCVSITPSNQFFRVLSE